jgi:hypothetical protein
MRNMSVGTRTPRAGDDATCLSVGLGAWVQEELAVAQLASLNGNIYTVTYTELSIFSVAKI